MQVIYKLDIFFILVYSIIIITTGAAFAISANNLWFLGGALGVEISYLFFALKKPLRRRKAVAQPFPAEWRTFLKERSLFYCSIIDAEHLEDVDPGRFERDVQIFLCDFPIEGIRRETIVINTKLLVASGFAAMLHGRPFWEPPIKDGVLVYPGRTFNKDYKIGKGRYAGMASPNSPLIISKESLEESFRCPGDGYNVIYHELAHYFDMEDGQAEGIPATRILADRLNPWKNIISREWKKALQGRSFLRSYAGTNEAELFAVATEFFFEKPAIMKRKNPGLYGLLSDFFNLDTAAIMKEEIPVTK